MPDKIGILCAGDDEVAPILSLLQGDAPSQQAMLTFHAGKLAGMDVVALYCGVCKVNAAIAAQLYPVLQDFDDLDLSPIVALL